MSVALPGLRIAFAGTPPFAAVALQHLLASGFDISLVWTQPDRPAGRGQRLQPSAVKQLAVEHGLVLGQPQGLRLDGKFAADAQEAQSQITAIAPDVMVVVAYGLILPAWVLKTPRLGCVNIHGSSLPRWRGAAPVQRAIEAGDTRTGITIIQMDEGLDTGAMLAHESLAIQPEETGGTLHDRLAPVGARLVADVLSRMAAHLQGRGPQPAATPQPLEGMSYAAKISKHEALIDWTQPAAVIERRLRAFDPMPGCSFVHDGQPLKIWRAKVVERDGAAEPGAVHVEAQRITVSCGEAALELIEVQKPGGRRISASQYLQAWRQPG